VASRNNNHTSIPTTRKMSSLLSQSSSSSLGEGKGNKKDLTKQRAEARRLKLDAQIHEVDIGRIEIGADSIASSPPGGISTNPMSPGGLSEEDAGNTTDDGDSTTASNHLTTPYTYPVVAKAVNRRLRQHSSNGVEMDVPPVTSISTTLQGEALQDAADNRSVASSTVSENDTSSCGKSLLYGKVSASPLQHPSQQHQIQSFDQSNNQNSSSGLGSGVVLGKPSSLIFPTGVVDASGGSSATTSTSFTTTAGVFSPSNSVQRSSAELKSHKINLLLDQCETVRFPFKKKLMLNSLDLTAADIPVKDLYGTNLGNSLHRLSLAGNRLSSIPPKLVTCLPLLKSLDLSQCELHQLPVRWNLPQLKRLNLSHNRLTDFPEEV
jgi:Leucine-rich repeat (LRR) protein